MLGHYDFGWLEEERNRHDESMRQGYEQTMTEWLAVEAIVKQRDRDIQAANLAKLSSDNSLDGQIPLHREASQDHDLENDVFEVEDDGEYLQNGTVSEKVKMQDSEDEADSKEVKEIMQEIPTSQPTEIPRSKSPRQDTLETESGRSLSENIDLESVSQKSSPHESDEGIGHLCSNLDEEEAEEIENNSSESCHSYKTDREVEILKADNFGNGEKSSIQPIEVNTYSGSQEQDDMDDSTLEKGEQGAALNVPDCLDASSHLSADSTAVSPVSSSGGVYSVSLILF